VAASNDADAGFDWTAGGASAMRVSSPRYPVTISNWCVSMVVVSSIVRGPTTLNRVKG
jgi:hypothetical protein